MSDNKLTPPALKKICLEGQRGKKYTELHEAYEEVSPGRLQCRAWYHVWLRDSVKVATDNGGSAVAAEVRLRRQTPPRKSVPTFAKAGTQTLKNPHAASHGPLTSVRSDQPNSRLLLSEKPKPKPSRI